jgi:hypothetical protein
MDYKEKLVELMTKCLNDEKLYERVIDQIDEYRCTPQSLAYKKVAAITCGCYDKVKSSVVDYYFNNVKYKTTSRLQEDFKLYDSTEYSKDKLLSELQVNFEEYPSLRLSRFGEEKSEQININIPNKRFFFFDGPKQHVIKTTYTYTSSYIIQQGSLNAVLTLEEANVLIDLYKNNSKKFEEKRDLKKLEARLKQYN